MIETVTETDGGYYRHCEKTVTETMTAAVTGVVTETDGGCDRDYDTRCNRDCDRGCDRGYDIKCNRD